MHRLSQADKAFPSQPCVTLTSWILMGTRWWMTQIETMDRWDWFHTGDLRWSSGFLSNSVCHLQPWVWNSPENCLGCVRKPHDISVIIGPQCLHCLHNWTSVVGEVSPIDRQNSSLDRRIRSSSVYEGRGWIIPRFLNLNPSYIQTHFENKP